MKHKNIHPNKRENMVFTIFQRGCMLREICRMFAQKLVYRVTKAVKLKVKMKKMKKKFPISFFLQTHKYLVLNYI